MALSLAFTDSRTSATSATTQTFNTGGDPSIGAAAADRIVAVAVAQLATVAGQITGMTIGGITATLASGSAVTDAAPAVHAAIFFAAVPTGTTATVVVTFPAAGGCCGISVYRITGATPTPAASNTSSGASSTTALSTTLTVPVGGASINAYFNRNSMDSGSAITWTNASQDLYVEAGGAGSFSGDFGSASVTASGSVTVTATDTGAAGGTPSQCCMTSVAWGPPPEGYGMRIFRPKRSLWR
jgi:hypothetical protein